MSSNKPGTVTESVSEQGASAESGSEEGYYLLFWPGDVKFTRRQSAALYWSLLAAIVVVYYVTELSLNRYYLRINEAFDRSEDILSQPYMVVFALVQVGLFLHLSVYALGLLYGDRRPVLHRQAIAIFQVLIVLLLLFLGRVLLEFTRAPTDPSLDRSSVTMMMIFLVNFLVFLTVANLSYTQTRTEEITNFNTLIMRNVATVVVVSMVGGLMWMLNTLILVPLEG